MHPHPTPQTHDAVHGHSLEMLAHSIPPGGWMVESKRPIATLLGSCVAVCLYDPDKGIGGMNHFMLPVIKKRQHADHDMMLSGNYAMEALLNAMLTKGAKKSRLQAKAFGGGNVISGLNQTHVGERNVVFTREWLHHEKIPLVASDFLGPSPRKIVLEPNTGVVYCRRIPCNDINASKIEKDETDYQKMLERKLNEPSIELF